MTRKSVALALTVALGGIASAQPGPPPQPPADTTITSDPGPPEPTPEPQPPVAQTAPAQPAMQTQTEASGDRPDGFAIALGLGYALPTSLQTPNITSARIRLSSGFEIEPAVRIANESASNELETPAMTDETTDKHTTFSLIALGRLTLIQRGRADFNVLASLGFTTDKTNPDGDFNTTTVNSFGLGWGIGVGYWFSPHWQLSMNVLNDLVTYSSTKTQAAMDTSMTTSTTEIGVTFAPQVFMMLHLYN